MPWIADFATITVENNRIVAIEGGELADGIRRTLEEHRLKYGDGAYVLDSFHGGMHPRADKRLPFVPHGRTDRVHFHERTPISHYGAGTSNQTVEIDGSKIYADGKLQILDDPKLREAAEHYGLEDWPGA